MYDIDQKKNNSEIFVYCYFIYPFALYKQIYITYQWFKLKMKGNQNTITNETIY